MRFFSALLLTLCLLPSALAGPISINYGTCSNFAVMAGTSVAANGAQTVIASGSSGVAPGNSMTGNLLLRSGVKEVNSQEALNCAADELILYDQLKSANCTHIMPDSDLSGLTLTPGVYCPASGFFMISATTLTLNGDGDSNAQWIFQMASTLTTSTATSFILQNGASTANVFWQVGSSATIGYSSSFIGNVLAYASISVDHDALVQGRLFAQAAVSFAGNDAINPAASNHPPMAPTAAPAQGTVSTLPTAAKSGASSVAATSTLVMAILSAIAMKAANLSGL